MGVEMQVLQQTRGSHVINLTLPAAEYHKRELGVVSKSALDLIDRSPAHYKSWADGIDNKQTDAMNFGSMFHMGLLEPKSFESTYVVEPEFGDCRYKNNKTLRDEWRVNNAARRLISYEDHLCITGMMEAVRKHPAASRLLTDGHSEVSLRWRDEESGLECKSRADYWVPSKKLVVDAKTCEDASPEGFARSVAKWRYHLQHALYAMGFAACGSPIEHFALLAVEKEPPYAVAVYLLDTAAVTKGHELARTGIETLRVCMESGEWVAYSNGCLDLSLPRWAA